jgi:hypothetical protein
LDAVSSTFPMVYDLRDSWRRASELAITYRRKAGGACPFVALVLSPRAELEQIALSAGGLVQIGPMGVTDKFASEATRTQFIHAMFSTLRQNLTDLAYGPAPCPWMNDCLLPKRDACYGVTTRLAMPGARCPREGSIVSIVHSLNTNSATPGALGFTARSGYHA